MMEVPESTELSSTEAKVTRRWRFLHAIEDSAKKRNNCRRVIKKFASWRNFKITVFILSLICLIIQSIEFFTIYYEYPTNIVLETTVRNDFRLPAVTLCFVNTVSTDMFCRFSPTFCERPSNLVEFCKKHPIYCSGNTTNLKIPMSGYYTNYSNQLQREVKNYLLYEHFNDDLYETYRHGNNPITRTFVLESPGILKCYSENLHLYQNALTPDTTEIDFNSSSGFLIMGFKLNLYKIRLFYASSKPQVFIGIHSPFAPNNPTFDGQTIYPGHLYEFQVELEREEHRLPPPYQTNCRDNRPSKDAKPFTNPNSYQMCLEMCKSEFATKVYDCNMALTMISSVSDLCFKGTDGSKPFRSSKPLSELKKERRSCMQDCKPECLKLHYKHKVAVKDLTIDGGDPEDFAQINIFVKNTEVTMLRHVPLYGGGEIFSYVGGLFGFWLGVSVFTFTDTIEKFCKKALKWKRGLKMDNVQMTPVSEIHLD